MHLENPKEWYKEGLYSLITGTVYGATSVAVGQPFDTIKTKMQAQSEFMGKIGIFRSVQKIWSSEGIIGFYHGSFPTLIGSVLFRSLQFSIFDSIQAYYITKKQMETEIPFTFGLKPRIIIGGLIAGFARSLIECPFEYAKVRGQTNQKWNLNEIYKGFTTLSIRTVGLMTSFFIFVDFFKRNTDFYGSFYGQFLLGGFSAVFAWILIWPLENVKNIIQADTKGVGKTPIDKLRYIVTNYGFSGLARGMTAGLTGVFFRNGFSMMIMQFSIRKFRELGLRD